MPHTWCPENAVAWVRGGLYVDPSGAMDVPSEVLGRPFATDGAVRVWTPARDVRPAEVRGALLRQPYAVVSQMVYVPLTTDLGRTGFDPPVMAGDLRLPVELPAASAVARRLGTALPNRVTWLDDAGRGVPPADATVLRLAPPEHLRDSHEEHANAHSAVRTLRDVTQSEDRLDASIARIQHLADQARRLPGRTVPAFDVLWQATLDLDHAAAPAPAQADEVLIGPQLRAYLTAVVVARQQLAQLPTGLTPQLRRLAEEVRAELPKALSAADDLVRSANTWMRVASELAGRVTAQVDAQIPNGPDAENLFAPGQIADRLALIRDESHYHAGSLASAALPTEAAIARNGYLATTLKVGGRPERTNQAWLAATNFVGLFGVEVHRLRHEDHWSVLIGPEDAPYSILIEPGEAPGESQIKSLGAVLASGSDAVRQALAGKHTGVAAPRVHGSGAAGVNHDLLSSVEPLRPAAAEPMDMASGATGGALLQSVRHHHDVVNGTVNALRDVLARWNARSTADEATRLPADLQADVLAMLPVTVEGVTWPAMPERSANLDAALDDLARSAERIRHYLAGAQANTLNPAFRSAARNVSARLAANLTAFRRAVGDWTAVVTHALDEVLDEVWQRIRHVPGTGEDDLVQDLLARVRHPSYFQLDSPTGDYLDVVYGREAHLTSRYQVGTPREHAVLTWALAMNRPELAGLPIHLVRDEQLNPAIAIGSINEPYSLIAMPWHRTVPGKPVRSFASHFRPSDAIGWTVPVENLHRSVAGDIDLIAAAERDLAHVPEPIPDRQVAEQQPADLDTPMIDQDSALADGFDPGLLHLPPEGYFEELDNLGPAFTDIDVDPALFELDLFDAHTGDFVFDAVDLDGVGPAFDFSHPEFAATVESPLVDGNTDPVPPVEVLSTQAPPANSTAVHHPPETSETATSAPRSTPQAQVRMRNTRTALHRAADRFLQAAQSWSDRSLGFQEIDTLLERLGEVLPAAANLDQLRWTAPSEISADIVRAISDTRVMLADEGRVRGIPPRLLSALRDQMPNSPLALAKLEQAAREYDAATAGWRTAVAADVDQILAEVRNRFAGRGRGSSATVDAAARDAANVLAATTGESALTPIAVRAITAEKFGVPGRGERADHFFVWALGAPTLQGMPIHRVVADGPSGAVDRLVVIGDVDDPRSVAVRFSALHEATPVDLAALVDGQPPPAGSVVAGATDRALRLAQHLHDRVTATAAPAYRKAMTNDLPPRGAEHRVTGTVVEEGSRRERKIDARRAARAIAEPAGGLQSAQATLAYAEQRLGAAVDRFRKGLFDWLMNGRRPAGTWEAVQPLLDAAQLVGDGAHLRASRAESSPAWSAVLDGLSAAMHETRRRQDDPAALTKMHRNLYSALVKKGAGTSAVQWEPVEAAVRGYRAAVADWDATVEAAKNDIEPHLRHGIRAAEQAADFAIRLAEVRNGLVNHDVERHAASLPDQTMAPMVFTAFMAELLGAGELPELVDATVLRALAHPGLAGVDVHLLGERTHGVIVLGDIANARSTVLRVSLDNDWSTTDLAGFAAESGIAVGDLPGLVTFTARAGRRFAEVVERAPDHLRPEERDRLVADGLIAPTLDLIALARESDEPPGKRLRTATGTPVASERVVPAAPRRRPHAPVHSTAGDIYKARNNLTFHQNLLKATGETLAGHVTGWSRRERRGPAQGSVLLERLMPLIDKLTGGIHLRAPLSPADRQFVELRNDIDRVLADLGEPATQRALDKQFARSLIGDVRAVQGAVDGLRTSLELWQRDVTEIGSEIGLEARRSADGDAEWAHRAYVIAQAREDLTGVAVHHVPTSLPGGRTADAVVVGAKDDPASFVIQLTPEGVRTASIVEHFGSTDAALAALAAPGVRTAEVVQRSVTTAGSGGRQPESGQTWLRSGTFFYRSRAEAEAADTAWRQMMRIRKSRRKAETTRGRIPLATRGEKRKRTPDQVADPESPAIDELFVTNDPIPALDVPAGPVTADPATAGPAAADPMTIDPVTAGPMTIDPAAAGPMTIDPMAVDSMAVDPLLGATWEHLDGAAHEWLQAFDDLAPPVVWPVQDSEPVLEEPPRPASDVEDTPADGEQLPTDPDALTNYFIAQAELYGQDPLATVDFDMSLQWNEQDWQDPALVQQPRPPSWLVERLGPYRERFDLAENLQIVEPDGRTRAPADERLVSMLSTLVKEHPDTQFVYFVGALDPRDTVDPIALAKLNRLLEMYRDANITPVVVTRGTPDDTLRGLVTRYVTQLVHQERPTLSATTGHGLGALSSNLDNVWRIADPLGLDGAHDDPGAPTLDSTLLGRAARGAFPVGVTPIGDQLAAFFWGDLAERRAALETHWEQFTTDDVLWRAADRADRVPNQPDVVVLKPLVEAARLDATGAALRYLESAAVATPISDDRPAALIGAIGALAADGRLATVEQLTAATATFAELARAQAVDAPARSVEADFRDFSVDLMQMIGRVREGNFDVVKGFLVENRGRITDPTPWLQALADLVPLMPGSERQLEMLAQAVLQCPPDARGSASPR